MLKSSRPLLCPFLVAVICSFSLSAAFAVPVHDRATAKVETRRPLDFDRDVRPVLAENCFKCHGFDEKQRMAGLRLDTPDGAMKSLASGKCAIAPGDLKRSELAERISSTGALKMPPAGSGKMLTPAQISTLRRWISEGARYQVHWAYLPPRRPALPTVKNTSWVRNPIDRFILARIEEERLHPSPEADKLTLLRRLSLDITGLPPTLDEQTQFLQDHSAGAYEKVVNRLLASPHYGERMALTWLDLARYADTHGYHIDSGREMWPWRNWVIDAYNRNLPYDQFTIQQIAGDLLPNATLDQKIATGFNRNHPIDFEGGAIPEEYAANYIFDRIDTTSTAFMGLTMRCGQCHDHKYDPISQKDYYRFFAFFHNVPENGLDGQTGNAAPFIKLPTPEQQAKLDEDAKQIALLESAGKARAADLATAQKARAALDAAIPTTMVMEEMPKPRDTFILVRGQYDKPSDKVTAGTPAFLPPLPPGMPANRLALAYWLVSPAHPLTARVAVNRLWQQVFVVGIVKTSENFGVLGDRPSHPELLDWLATEFVRIGWDQKAMLKLIVSSAAYRQSSAVSPEMREIDPENRLLTHAPRYRLPAEFVRDQALAVSGLLVPKIGGPSVKPYQTPGLWEELAFGGAFSQQKYVQDHGESLYRRGIYTFWKRTCPPTTLQTFDAPEREFCIVRRSVTDTPLQALALMNDPTFVEAARKMAERLITDAGLAPRDRLNMAYRLTMARSPRQAEITVLLGILTGQMAKYRKDPESARKLLSVGESPRNEKLDVAELAAWSTVCSTILNLDETITRN